METLDQKGILEGIRNYSLTLMRGSSAQNPLWNQEQQLAGKQNRWNYIDGCMMLGLLSLYEITGEEEYLSFTDSFMSGFVEEDGTILLYDPSLHRLDDINPGKALLRLYDLTGKERYLSGAKRLFEIVKSQPRTKEGSFWHKDIYPWQIWLDGLYMVMPFYMEYETRFNGMREYMDVIRQFRNVHRLMHLESGLYCHGYDETRSLAWADSETGRSPHVWLRALGWFMMALVDTLEKMDEQLYYEYRELISMLRGLADALLPWQHEEGMFYQVVDHPDAEGNYLETSGSVMIAYALLKAVRLGFLPKRYAEVGEHCFWGIAKRYLKLDGNMIELGGICLVAGLGGKGEEHRDGSLEYYFSEPVVSNEAKGIAPFLMAYAEILRRSGDAHP